MDGFSVKRSYRDGRIKLAFSSKASNGYSDLRVEGSVDITPEQARDLATALIAEADRIEDKMRKRAAQEARRKAWRERQIAAGKMQVFTAADILRRG